MSFGGHVLDMINRMKYNDSLKSKRRNRKSGYSKSYKYSEKPEYKKISKEKLEKIKIRIREDAMANKKRYHIKLTGSLIIFLVLLYSGLKYLNVF